MGWKSYIPGIGPALMKRHQKKKKAKEKAKRANGGKTPSHFKMKGDTKKFFKGKPVTYEAGKKYSRLMQLRTVSDQQQKLLDKFMEHVSPEKFEKPYGYRKGMQALRHALDFDQASPVEQEGAQYLQNVMNQPIQSDPDYLRNLEAQSMRQYNEQIIPGLSERFSGLGALNSSAFQQASAQAGASLAERLAGLRGQFGQEQQQLNLQQQGMGLNAANMAMGYGQLPYQRNIERANIAQGLMGQSLIPQQYQNVYDQQALQRQMQQRSAVLGTSPYSYMNIMPGTKRTGALASMMPGLATGVGAGIGAAAGNAILPGIGGWLGGMLGSSAAKAATGATGPEGTPS